MSQMLAIDGLGWSMSFQRRVGTANRGVIPCVSLDSPSDRMRVLVPLRPGEALWIAVTAGPAILVSGTAGDRALRVETVSLGNDESVLVMLDAVFESNQWTPIDANSVRWADHREAIAGDPLAIVLTNPVAATTQRIAIVPATAALYQAISGFPAPGDTTQQDEYRGWRLP